MKQLSTSSMLTKTTKTSSRRLRIIIVDSVFKQCSMTLLLFVSITPGHGELTTKYKKTELRCGRTPTNPPPPPHSPSKCCLAGVASFTVTQLTSSRLQRFEPPVAYNGTRTNPPVIRPMTFNTPFYFGGNQKYLDTGFHPSTQTKCVSEASLALPFLCPSPNQIEYIHTNHTTFALMLHPTAISRIPPPCQHAKHIYHQMSKRAQRALYNKVQSSAREFGPQTHVPGLLLRPYICKLAVIRPRHDKVSPPKNARPITPHPRIPGHDGAAASDEES